MMHTTQLQAVLHHRYNNGRGICCPVCVIVHIKEPLLLIGKSSPCGDSSFLSLYVNGHLTIAKKCVECIVKLNISLLHQPFTILLWCEGLLDRPQSRFLKAQFLEVRPLNTIVCLNPNLNTSNNNQYMLNTAKKR